MSANHTPGPWSLRFRHSAFSGEWFDGVVGPDGEQIRVEGMTLTTGEVAMANARLIAAAPELLTFLQDFAGDFAATSDPDVRAYVNDALALIAAATPAPSTQEGQ
jgi:hypothetical protein